MSEVELPDGTIVEFPNGSSPGLISSVLRRHGTKGQALYSSLNSEMSYGHKGDFYNPVGDPSAAWAQSLYNMPGQLASDLITKEGKFGHMFTGYDNPSEDIRNTINTAIGADDINSVYAPETPFEKSVSAIGDVFAPEMVGGLAGLGVRAAPSVLRGAKDFSEALVDDITRSGVRDQAGMIGSTGAKNADMEALKLAEEMKASGASPDDIYSQTKWWLDHPDGRPRFEIDDSGAQWWGDKVRHPNGLYKAYDTDTDALRDIQWSSRTGPEQGQYSRSDSPTLMGKERIDVSAPYDQRKTSVGLHELQHAIQGREGMARGGSPEYVQKESIDIWAEGKASADDAVRIKIIADRDGLSLSEARDWFKRELGRDPAAGALMDARTNDLATLKRYRKEASDKVDELISKYTDPGKAYADYRALAGETEARLVQDRMNLSMGERLANPFYKNFDVPLDEQIVRRGDGTAMSMAERVDKRVLAERRVNNMFDNVPNERRQAPRREMAVKNDMTDVERQDNLLKGLMADDMRQADMKLDDAIINDWRVGKGVKVGKNARIWRGISDDDGPHFARYGSGTYSTTSKKDAMEYAGKSGRVEELSSSDLPSNALRFDTNNDYEIWMGQVHKSLGIKGNRDMGERFGNVDEFLRTVMPDVDGIQIGKGNNAEFVKWADNPQSLPTDEASRMARAREMGFDVDNVYYHGTGNDFEKFKGDSGGAYFTDNPYYADRYTTRNGESGRNIIPVHLKKEAVFDTRKPEHRKIYEEKFLMKYGNGTPLKEDGLPDWVESHDFQEFFKEEGLPFDAAIVGEPPDLMPDGTYKNKSSLLVTKEENIRSKFAQFDPAKKNSANLLAGGAAAAVGLDWLADDGITR